ncbi:hypothetical protein, partial [Mesorhizobium sp. M0207]|uniref:hypothetical protein n=1 Tax=Mesorhizobium sp. M0207 TaxID=2956915 RepID=UPI00333C89EF
IEIDTASSSAPCFSVSMSRSSPQAAPDGVSLALTIKIHEVPVEDYPLVVSIARWANQPLHLQAITSVNVEVTLLLHAVASEARPD